MKKNLSLAMAVVFAINIFSFITFGQTTVNALEADEAAFDGVTFSKIAYSPELKLFVAAANESNKGRLYISHDGEVWALAKTFEQSIGGEPSNDMYNDTLIWWGSEQVFAVYFGSAEKIYTSSNGYDWEDSGMTDIKNTGGIVTDGETLIHFYRNKIRIYSDTVTYEEYNFVESDTKPTGAAVSPPDDENDGRQTYLGIRGYMGGLFYTGGEGRKDIPSFTAYSDVREIIFSKKYDSFYAVGDVNANANAGGGVGRKIGKITRDGGTSEIEPAGLPSTRTSMYTIAEGETHLLVGLVERNSSGTFVTTDFYRGRDNNGTYTPWEKIEPATPDDALNHAIPRRSIYVDGKYYVVVNKRSSTQGSVSAIAVFDENLTSYRLIKNYRRSLYSINLNSENRIEIPAQGQPDSTVTYSPQVLDLKNNVINDPVDSIAVTTALPVGVEFNSSTFTVSSSAEIGQATLRVAMQSGLVKDFTITFVKEASIVINGNLNLIVPVIGEPPQEIEFTASVLDNNGDIMNRTATIGVSPSTPIPSGASVKYSDGNTKLTLTLTGQTSKGAFDLIAVSSTEPGVSVTETVNVARREASSIEILSGKASITIPDSGKLEEAYVANIKDQNSIVMSDEATVWSVKDTQTGRAVENISINPQTGILTVDSNARDESITIVAAAKSNELIKTELDVILQYTVLRQATYDMNDIDLKVDLDKVTGDITLPVVGRLYESTITWASSNTKVVANNGAVTRLTESDTSVVLTATVKKDGQTKIRTFTLKVLKNDNILQNGNFEADVTGWESTGDAQISMVNSVGLDESKALHVGSRTSAASGVIQTVQLKNNSTYMFEAFVKGTVGNQSLAITSENSKYAKIAEIKANDNIFVRMSGMYSYTGKAPLFNENIEISSRFSNSVDDFYVDNFKVIEITLELNELISTIQKAENSKSAADINTARELLEAFYDIPQKDEWSNRIDAIGSKSGGIGTGTGTSKGTGGGGISGGGGTTQVSLPNVGIKPPDNSEAVFEHFLKFKDLKGHWALEDVEYMAEQGFVKGKDDGVFAPDDEITRAEFVIIAIRTIGESPKTYLNSFYDVEEGDWHSGYIQAAKDLGLISGSNGLFKPDDKITREEMTKIIISAYNQKTNTTLQTGRAVYFNDYYKISSWAYDYVACAVDLELVNGVSENIFSPLTLATRAQATVLLKRLHDKIMPDQEVGEE